VGQKGLVATVIVLVAWRPAAPSTGL